MAPKHRDPGKAAASTAVPRGQEIAARVDCMACASSLASEPFHGYAAPFQTTAESLLYRLDGRNAGKHPHTTAPEHGGLYECSARASMAAMGRDGGAVSGGCHMDESTRGLIMEAMGRDGE